MSDDHTSLDDALAEIERLKAVNTILADNAQGEASHCIGHINALMVAEEELEVWRSVGARIPQHARHVGMCAATMRGSDCDCGRDDLLGTVKMLMGENG